jgi:hypothetical protein
VIPRLINHGGPKLKPENLSPKALLVLVNMHGMEGPVRSSDFEFLSPKASGAKEWAFDALKSLKSLNLLNYGPTVGNSKSFTVNDLGKKAMLEQNGPVSIDVDETLYYYDGPLLFTAVIHGAARLVMADDLEEKKYLVSTPNASTLDDVINSRVKIVEGMACEPCFWIEKSGDGWAMTETGMSAVKASEYCGESGYLDPEVHLEKKREDAAGPEL